MKGLENYYKGGVSYYGSGSGNCEGRSNGQELKIYKAGDSIVFFDGIDFLLQ